MSFNNWKIRNKKCSSVQKSFTAIYKTNTGHKYFTSLNEVEADTSIETCNFISEGTFRFFWRISVICLYLNTNPSSVFKHAASYIFCTHQERPKYTWKLLCTWHNKIFKWNIPFSAFDSRPIVMWRPGSFSKT